MLNEIINEIDSSDWKKVKDTEIETKKTFTTVSNSSGTADCTDDTGVWLLAICYGGGLVFGVDLVKPYY